MLERSIEKLLSYTNSEITLKNVLGGLKLSDIHDYKRLFDEELFKYTYRITLGQGLSFGELGLIQDRKRSATLICLEDSYLAYLTKVDYISILNEIESQRLATKCLFFIQKLFELATVEQMEKIIVMFSIKEYRQGDIIF